MRRAIYSGLLFCQILLSGCASTDAIDLATSDAERLYLLGKESLESGYYEAAIQHFETLEARYPFGIYAQQGTLDMAYAYHKYSEPESAITIADQFIKTYPRHDKVDYAYYLRGLARFKSTSGFFDRKFDRDPALRDPRSAQESFQYFAELVERYPESQYAEDAIQRMVYLKNYLARHEMHVADYYMERGAYIAAVNRSKYVLENYPQTPSIPKALAVMAAGYQQLGVQDLAADALRVLEMNYPDSGLNTGLTTTTD